MFPLRPMSVCPLKIWIFDNFKIIKARRLILDTLISRNMYNLHSILSLSARLSICSAVSSIQDHVIT